MRVVRVGDVARARSVLVPVLVPLDVDSSSSHRTAPQATVTLAHASQLELGDSWMSERLCCATDVSTRLRGAEFLEENPVDRRSMDGTDIGARFRVELEWLDFSGCSDDRNRSEEEV